MKKLAVMVCVIALAHMRGSAGTVTPPPNAPAEVKWNAEKGTLQLHYHGQLILDAVVGVEGKDGKPIDAVLKLEPQVNHDDKDKVEQRLHLTLAEPKDGAKLVLRATLAGSEEAFPAETLGEPQKRFPMVRNSVGLSRNLRNHAVYDRHWDWVLIGPADGATRITPISEDKQMTRFWWESSGSDLDLVFRPRFYQKFHDLPYFEPWTYRVWKGSVTGYCTWWAYKYDFTQETVDEFVALFDEKWDADTSTLSGQSAVVTGDPYVLTVHLPDGFRLKSAEMGGAKVEAEMRAETATVRFVPELTRTVEWKLLFAR